MWYPRFSSEPRQHSLSSLQLRHRVLAPGMPTEPPRHRAHSSLPHALTIAGSGVRITARRSHDISSREGTRLASRPPLMAAGRPLASPCSVLHWLRSSSRIRNVADIVITTRAAPPAQSHGAPSARDGPLPGKVSLAPRPPRAHWLPARGAPTSDWPPARGPMARGECYWARGTRTPRSLARGYRLPPPSVLVAARSARARPRAPIRPSPGVHSCSAALLLAAAIKALPQREEWPATVRLAGRCLRLSLSSFFRHRYSASWVEGRDRSPAIPRRVGVPESAQ